MRENSGNEVIIWSGQVKNIEKLLLKYIKFPKFGIKWEKYFPN